MQETPQDTYATGRCHCGGVRYTLRAAPSFQFLCHCEGCQRINGGMRLAGATFAGNALQTDGDLREYSYDGGKGQITTYFCGTCGTPVYARPKIYGDMVVVRAGTLESPAQFVPEKSIFSQSACAWETLIDAKKQTEQQVTDKE